MIFVKMTKIGLILIILFSKIDFRKSNKKMSVCRSLSLIFHISPDDGLKIDVHRFFRLGKIAREGITIEGCIDEIKDVFSSIFTEHKFVGENLNFLDIDLPFMPERKILLAIKFIIDEVIGESYSLAVKLKLTHYSFRKEYEILFAVLGEKARKITIESDINFINEFNKALPRMSKLENIYINERNIFTGPQFITFSKNLLLTNTTETKITLGSKINVDIFQKGILPLFSEKSKIRKITLKIIVTHYRESVFTEPKLLDMLTELIIKTPRVIDFVLVPFTPGGMILHPDPMYPDPRIVALFHERMAEFEYDELRREEAVKIMSATRGQLHGSVAINASEFV